MSLLVRPARASAQPEAPGTSSAASDASVELADLTWTELQARVAAGTTTVLVPLGGTEQSGPQLALGKHNARAQVLAERIARRLGHTLVAPVLAYVPEGNISPPSQHMRYPGTISIPVAAFEATLEGTARSLLAHGICHVVFLPDHGGYLGSVERVAAKLQRENAHASRSGVRHGAAASTACGAIALTAYYRASGADFAQALQAQGFSPAEIGTHAGLADTALTLAIVPAMVRTDAATLARGAHALGVAGDPRRATAALGRPAAEHVVDAAVAAIQAALRDGLAPAAPAHRGAP